MMFQLDEYGVINLCVQDSMKYENPALYSHEHAMAKPVSYTHLTLPTNREV